MFNFWKISLRDLLRNRRRSLLTLLAVVIGVSLLIFVSGFYKGIFDGSMAMSIQLQTSHLQVRAPSYNEDQLSMQWKDLLNDPQGLTHQIQAIPGVQAATPVLWASGMVLSGEESVGVRIDGVDPASPILAPIRQALVTGQIPAADDRSGVLIGKNLADTLGLSVGQDVILVINTSNQTTDQAAFTIRGLFDTGVGQYDDSTVYLPLSRAQVFGATGDRASAIRVMLTNQDNADAFAAAFRTPNLTVLTWRDLNTLLLSSATASTAFLQILNLIVLGMVAVVIANTLLMAVFERTREIGILTSLGMKRRQVLSMFLLEAGMLGAAGTALGVAVGAGIVFYYSKVGINFSQEVIQAKASNMITYGKLLYTSFSSSQALEIAVIALAITLIVAVYPAWFASRMEPIQALHGK
ncbi:MAG TPA: ABC transporter permease [Anaerolineaceae bacterium]|jgi:ABC-type lipoprotein release transport system permease subunit